MKKFAGLLGIYLLLLGACATQQKNHIDPVVEKLQQGGYVIFFRHAATDHSQKDIDKKNLENCETQRRLDEKGRQQSKDIGDGFKALSIPVGEVITSHYCRCINTAKIAFGKATPTMDITSIQDVTPEVRQERIANLRKMLATLPEPGTNTILVAHKWMFKDASGHLLEEGEAAIFQPQAHNTAHFIRRVKPEEWVTLKGQ
ncbi:histidine phosphatase family protein [Kaarinaea lacus]